MNLAAQILAALRRSPKLTLDGLPADVATALSGLHTLAKSDATTKAVADVVWQERQAALSAKGVDLPAWMKPSVIGTPAGQAARADWIKARRAQTVGKYIEAHGPARATVKAVK
jgi:hypothetical protein